MTKARDLADFVSAGNPLADGTIDVADINGITATTTELNYTDGVTSNIQTQLDAKVDLAGDTMTGNLAFGDNVQARFGAGPDLLVYHDGGHSYVTDSGTGNLYISGDNVIIRNTAGTDLKAQYISDGAVNLFYDNSKKFETTATGVAVTGDATFADNGKAIFGAGSDLQIYHDGSNSYIRDLGTGNLIIQGTNLALSDAAGTQFMSGTSGGPTYIKHQGSVKLNTTATGVTVTGTAIATTNTNATATGSVTLDFAANQNFILTLTGNVTLANPTTEQVGQSGFIVFIQDATGGRTVSLGTDYETAGGAGLTLSSTANTTDIVPYIVVASGRILLGAPQLAFA